MEHDAPKRILFVITSSDVGGTESFLERLVDHLDRTRFKPMVCSLRGVGSVGRRLASSGVPVFSFGLSEQATVPETASAIWALRRIIDARSIDLIHALLYRANFVTALAARLSRRRPVVLAGQRSLTSMGGSIAERATRWTWPLCTKVVAVSEAVRDHLVRQDRISKKHIVVIGNGVDTARFRPTGTAGDLRASRLPKPLVVGGVGRLSYEKGYAFLLRAVAEAIKSGCSLQLCLVGDGNQRVRLKALARNLGIDEAVRFLGHRDDVEELYRQMDIFVLPSLEEGSPNALLEAMSCGRPPVATTVGGVPEIIEQDKCGLLVAPGSVGELALAIRRLYSDPALRSRLGKAARARVEAHFSLEQMIRAHESLYWDLLSSSS